MKNTDQQQAVSWYLPSEGTPLVIPQRPNNQEFVAIIFGIILLTIFPLMVGPLGYGDITEFKFWDHLVIICTFVLVTLLSMLSYVLSTERDKKKPEFRFTLPMFLLLGYLAAVVVSSFFTPYDYNVWMGGGRYEGIISVLLYVSTFLLFSCYGTYSGWYIRGLALTGIPIGIIGILQLLGNNPLKLFPDGAGTFASHPFIGTLGNIDMVAGYISLALPAIACAYILLREKKSRLLFLASFVLILFIQLKINVDSGKMGLLAAAVVMLPILAINQERIVGILEIGSAGCLTYALHRLITFLYTIEDGNEVYSVSFSFNRAVLIFAAAALILFAASIFLRKKAGVITLPPKVLRLILVGILLLLIIGALVFLYSYQGSNALLTQIHDVLHGTLDDLAGSGRGYVWKKSILMISEKPLLGSGPDSFVYRFDQYNDEFNQISGSNVYFDYAHNDFLQIGVNYGLIGLGFYLAFIVALAVRMFRVIDRNPLVCIFAAGIVGYLVHSFFAFSIAIVTPLFWVFAGLLEHCIRQTLPLEGSKMKAAKK